jgi:hypothetical protein
MTQVILTSATDENTHLSKREEEGDDLTSPHGVISCIAWLLLVIGAVLMRVLGGPKTWLIHASTQALGVLFFIVGTGMGIYIATTTDQVSRIFTSP